MGRLTSRFSVEERVCRAGDLLLRKFVINRLPPKTMLWSRFSEHLRPLVVGNVALDLGCGSGSQLPFDKSEWLGVDLHLASLIRARAKRKYRHLICANVLDVNGVFRPKSFDTVIALDLIEHFDKDQGLFLLGAMEELARHRVIVLTPNGRVEQDPSAISSNQWMEHRSAWSSADMKRLGYHVTGWSGWKGFAGPNGYFRRRMDALFQILMTLSQPFVYDKPRLAFHLFCWKDVCRTPHT